jgi:uncharacterized membrane protein YbhN (UPF0104 family)
VTRPASATARVVSSFVSKVEVEYIEPESLPEGLDDRRLRRRAVGIVGVLVVVGLVAAFAPGLGEVRDRLAGALPGWLALAVLLELLSCLSYVLMFRPIFCPRMSRRTSYELAMSELAVGSLVPASGAAGLAFGAWALRRGGMAAKDIARRTVAFFVLKSAANFVAVAVIGTAMWLGLGPEKSPLLTIVPALLAMLTIAAVPLIPRLAARSGSRGGEALHGWRRWLAWVGDALGDGVREAGRIVRRRDVRVIAGSLGYWAFDNAVLWACFRAFGESPAITLVLMGYLLGQLGGLLPIPGGIGGVDGGLFGALVAYGLPAAATAAAILAYRVILFWLPLVLGGAAFLSLRKGLQDPNRPDICDPLARIGQTRPASSPAPG